MSERGKPDILASNFPHPELDVRTFVIILVMGNPTYFLILLGMLSISFVVHKQKNLQLFVNLKHFLLYFTVIFISGLVWDYFSVSQRIWLFPEGGTLGLRIGLLPIEEYLFFAIVPYFGLVTHKFLEGNSK